MILIQKHIKIIGKSKEIEEFCGYCAHKTRKKIMNYTAQTQHRADTDRRQADRRDRYIAALAHIPAPGGGGCHSSLLAAANLGIIAGITPAQIHADIRQSIPAGGRFVQDSEIAAAVKKAAQDIDLTSGYNYRPAARPRPLARPENTADFIRRGAGVGELELFEASPIRLLDDPANDWRIFIEALFEPQEFIFCGSQKETHIRKASEVLRTGEIGEFIAVNPFTGEPAPTKSGGTSCRCDSAVAAFRHCLVEFDNLPLADQMQFFAAIPLKITALIYSGGKSIHGIIRLDSVLNLADWQQEVKTGLFERILKPLGADAATANPSRTTRTPSVKRGENWQKLLYLDANPTARPIIDR